MPHFSSMSDDVLMYIFVTATMEEKDDGRPYHWRHPLPIRLSQLSSRLRRIAINSPLLWTTLDGGVMESSATLDWFLERSQNCGLIIEVHDDMKGRFGKVLRNFGKLVVCVNRWRTLDILTSSEKDLQIALAHFLDLCAPNLNRISISCIYDGYDRESPDKALTTAIFTGGTPVLKSLDLSGVACFPNSLSTLTSLSLKTLPGCPTLFRDTRFRKRLLSMCSLVHLTCIGRITRWPSLKAVKAVDLPSLRSLTIMSPYDGCIDGHSVSALCATLPTTTSTLFS